MPSGTHTTELTIPIEQIWEFVRDMNKWAPLVPGYIDHDILNDSQSTWTFHVDLGILHRKISLKIDITKWQKPTKVTFDLTGLNEKFSGNGYFEAQTIDESTTKMTGNLDITAKGMKGSVINPVLKSYVPNMTEELTEAIANTLKEQDVS
ncbi:carbon monoxide dehydrogenase subunit G [Virgibacillus natechei]|uniref:Carbon monoxide dehydrogenase subunit G n=1 Tax=Virgibacillus natechei TaxID=1216297 RepID=A0ABS4IJQ5_9BACI|nr:SRPBCC family protein [Virgibacillus natechei]MBP1971145.1 carbon monoxide dehydrogenase subunit G [Virgibacillus natechei]UZD12170.1 SRPBCC family protein [Virgibacillus natechei]